MKRVLDQWIGEQLGMVPLDRDTLEQYQWKKIKETVDFVREKSPFYEKKFAGYPMDTPEDFSWLPFTLPEELSREGESMVCLPPGEIGRIVTMETSGSVGAKKRIFFTEEEQRQTMDFFRHGMKFLLEKGDCVLILLPCRMPGSVGDLLEKAIKEPGVETCCLGPIGEELSYNTILDVIYKKGVNSIVGSPTQVHNLMKHTTSLTMKTVLLTGEYISSLVVKDLEEIWNARVFEHYGMTEMGLGCAVSCGRGKGYHIREQDLFIEIINEENGEVVPDGRWGEVVFTSLRRKGMPLIRYRTGDVSRIIKEPCSCGSVLRRLDRVKSRDFLKGWL